MNCNVNFLEAQIFSQYTILTNKMPHLVPFFVYLNPEKFSKPIPFLPIRCFKDFTIDSTNPSLPNSDKTYFISSGSTGTTQSQHVFSKQALQNYANKAVEGFLLFLQQHSFLPTTPIISLIPPPNLWPQSSLAFMLAEFKKYGLNVIYVDTSTSTNALANLMKKFANTEDAMIFGTSFHHVQNHFLSTDKRPLFFGRRLGIVDTGGTKGRTEAFIDNDIYTFILQTYGNHCESIFLSEYGMCELASQAYATENLYNASQKIFRCNPDLHAFAINLHTKSSCPTNSPGFLGFIDRNNTDSYMCVLTEDLGIISSKSNDNYPMHEFTLIGRAPDASLKGCSLNIRSTLIESEQKTHKNITKPINHANKKYKILQKLSNKNFIKHLTTSLPCNIWNNSTLFNLQQSFLKVHKLKDYFCKNPPPQFYGKTLQIVASANIPITWVFPAIIASIYKFSYIQIHIPSYRANDISANLVREQIYSLVNAISSLILPTKIKIIDTGIKTTSDIIGDTFIVFGTDTTCKIFTQWFSGKPNKLLTFGDITNSLCVNSSNFTQINTVAKTCTQWQGRGCLTPVVLFLDKKNYENSQLYATLLCNAMEQELQKYDINSNTFMHAHNKLDIISRLSSIALNYTERMHLQKFAAVINLSNIEPKLLQQAQIPLYIGGQGLVFLADKCDMNHEYFSDLANYNPNPNIFTPHMGKTWMDWLK